MMTSLALVALGGAAGASLRFLVGQAVVFPMGTVAVNIAGSLAIGALWVLLEGRASQLAPLLITGLLGGFTTFSAFGYETIALAREGHLAAAAANGGLQVALGLIAVWIGLSVSHSITLGIR